MEIVLTIVLTLTELSYYCTCDNGYELSDDKHTCEGNVVGKYLYVFKIVIMSI